VDGDGRMYLIRELYGCTSTPNTGVKHEPHEQARRIKEVENTDPRLKGRKISVGSVADPAIWNKSTGVSVAEAMESEGVYFDKGDHERLAGLMQCHYRLAFDENGYSMFYVFSDCLDFIRTVPNLTYDEKNVEDIDSSQEDHIYDSWRYACMKNPIKARMNYIDNEAHDFDPLNLYQGNAKRRLYRG